MGKQIFISYRRDGAEALAQLLYSRLTSEGYDVFLDVESLRSGKFNEALYKEIEQCTDFLLILPPNGLDRCFQENDWVRLEIECALRLKKNIIPVMMRNFTFPENLPAPLSELPNFNGISANMDLFDGVILKLKKMFLSKPKATDSNTKYPLTKDPDFSDGFFEKYLANEKAENKNDMTTLDFVDKNKLYQIRYDGYGLAPHLPSGCINYANEAYEIYDIFTVGDKKYAYTLKATELKLNDELPKVTFFEIDKNDKCHKIETRDPNSPFVFYSSSRRGMGVIPQTLRMSAEYVFKLCASEANISTDDLNATLPYYSLENLISPHGICGIWKRKLHNDVILQIALNITTTFYQVESFYFKPEDSERIKKYSCYLGNNDRTPTKQKYFSYSNNSGDTVSVPKVKTPLDDYTILDIAAIQNMTNRFIIFAYPQQKNNIDQLKKIPTFFDVWKDKNGYLSIKKISDEQSFQIVIKPLIERFAIVAAQIDQFFPAAFR